MQEIGTLHDLRQSFQDGSWRVDDVIGILHVVQSRINPSLDYSALRDDVLAGKYPDAKQRAVTILQKGCDCYAA